MLSSMEFDIDKLCHKRHPHLRLLIARTDLGEKNSNSVSLSTFRQFRLS